MRDKVSHLQAFSIGSLLGVAGGLAIMNESNKRLEASAVSSETDAPEIEILGDDDSAALPEEFCESEDWLSQEGLAMRPRPFCVEEETSFLYVDQGRFDALGSFERDHIDPGLSAFMTFNCGGDDEDRVDYELIASSYGFVPHNDLPCMESEITLSRFLAGQIVTLSQSTDTCYAGLDPSRLKVVQRIEVKDAGLDADEGFVHERGFAYGTPKEYEVAMGMAVDEEGEPLPALPGGPTTLHALQGVLDDASGLFYSSESVFLHPNYACPY